MPAGTTISMLAQKARFLPLAMAVIVGSMASATSPIIGTPSAAERLYLTILPTLPGHPKLETRVVVWDKGDHWVVFQPSADPNIRGGGTPEMTINKADGSVNLAFAR